MYEHQPGDIVGGRYRLDRVVAEGGMGVLWAGEDLRLRRPVAVKLLHSLGSALARQRFAREAVAIATLSGPHIVQIYDYAVDRFEAFIVMELLDGEDLSERLARCGRLSLDETVRIIWGTARALTEVHAAGIVHRDLKPGNIFLARSEHTHEIVKLLDFGVAKVDASTSLSGEYTRVGALLGTPQFMSPEQARGLAVDADHRSDLWSLGVIAYRALTGQLPFVGHSLPDSLVRVCTQPLVPPTFLAPDLPPALDAFFQRALARNPEARFANAHEMAEAFHHACERRPSMPPSDRISMPPMLTETQQTWLTTPTQTSHRASRTVSTLSTLALGVALVIGMVGGAVYDARASTIPAPQAKTGLRPASIPSIPSYRPLLPRAVLTAAPLPRAFDPLASRE